jgi:hypothetical protein
MRSLRPASQTLDGIDPELSSSPLPSLHGPPALLSQRFHPESDSEHDPNNDDLDDSDRTENESPAGAVSTARLKALNKRSGVLGE